MLPLLTCSCVTIYPILCAFQCSLPNSASFQTCSFAIPNLVGVSGISIELEDRASEQFARNLRVEACVPTGEKTA